MTATDHRAALIADPFTRIPLNTDAVDQAWADHIARRLSSIDACRAMERAGTTWPEAVALLQSTTMPSTARTLAGAR